eukprot:341784-Amphidinium_carterae.1
MARRAGAMVVAEPQGALELSDSAIRHFASDCKDTALRYGTNDYASSVIEAAVLATHYDERTVPKLKGAQGLPSAVGGLGTDPYTYMKAGKWICTATPAPGDAQLLTLDTFRALQRGPAKANIDLWMAELIRKIPLLGESRNKKTLDAQLSLAILPILEAALPPHVQRRAHEKNAEKLDAWKLKHSSDSQVVQLQFCEARMSHVMVEVLDALDELSACADSADLPTIVDPISEAVRGAMGA